MAFLGLIMKIYRFLLLLVVMVVGCQPEVVDVTGTPTATIPPLVGEPIPVELSALAANPTVYEDAYIQLTGQYTRQPRLVCESNPHPSPVTWGLGSDTLLALAGGFDEQLRPLLPQGLTMTVAGRWRHWRGDVGCGESVQPQDLWYLQVTEIISPSPITQVTLTPGGAPIAQVGETPTAETSPSDEAAPPQPAEDSTAVVPTQQPPSQATESSGQATAVTNPTSATATTAVTSDPRMTPTPTDPFTAPTATSSGSNTATPTRSSSGTATPTPRPGATVTTGPTPTTSSLATSTPAPNTENLGPADPETLLMDYLDGDEMHLWTFDNELSNNTLKVQVAPSALVNIAIEIYDPSGTQIADQNSAGTGEIETIANLSLPAEGNYKIIVTDSNGIGGDYAILTLDSISFDLTFHQIEYGIPENTSFTEDEEQLWFFDGEEDETVTITAAPTSGTPDIGFEFIGPFADPLEYIDDLFEDSDPEVLSNYTLANTGLHAIWLFGSDSGTINVQLSVDN
jgi:hypothetical protein